jgi:ribosome maturation factor RimP
MTSVYDKERALLTQIRPRIESELPGIDVLALELVRNDRICVYIDHPEGVTLEHCEAVTRTLDGFRSEFGIDVSSPGSNRPLRTSEHFTRVVGSKVNIRTDRKVDGETRFRGQLVSAGPSDVTVATGETTVNIPYALIVRGNLIDEG